MKITYLVVAALVFVMAALQFNDPDPIYWIAVYSATALVIAARAFGRVSRFWSGVALGGVLAGMLISVGGFLAYLSSAAFGSIFGDMLASPSYVEETREFLGLAICLIALTWRSRR